MGEPQKSAAIARFFKLENKKPSKQSLVKEMFQSDFNWLVKPVKIGSTFARPVAPRLRVSNQTPLRLWYQQA